MEYCRSPCSSLGQFDDLFVISDTRQIDSLILHCSSSSVRYMTLFSVLWCVISKTTATLQNLAIFSLYHNLLVFLEG